MISTARIVAQRVAFVLATVVAGGVVAGAAAASAAVPVPPPPIVKPDGTGDRSLPARAFPLVGPDGKVLTDAAGKARTATISPAAVPPPPKNR